MIDVINLLAKMAKLFVVFGLDVCVSNQEMSIVWGSNFTPDGFSGRIKKILSVYMFNPTVNKVRHTIS